ncbi:hypothetical protein [Cryobacterium gelidum]|uniref:hypothetical protein n=1 Tax=Cryobacterium gelidum TaxID=1259164 RepID=UPI001583ACCD|nr:hypothetical protein [Cryobacterium gelidum]
MIVIVIVIVIAGASVTSRTLPALTKNEKAPTLLAWGEVRNMSGPIVGVGELRLQRYGVRPEKRLKKVEKYSLLPLRADRIPVGRFVINLLQCNVIDRSGVPVLAAPADPVAGLLVEISHIGRDPQRGGYERPVFSAAEFALRDWFLAHATKRGRRT